MSTLTPAPRSSVLCSVCPSSGARGPVSTKGPGHAGQGEWRGRRWSDLVWSDGGLLRPADEHVLDVSEWRELGDLPASDLPAQ